MSDDGRYMSSHFLSRMRPIFRVHKGRRGRHSLFNLRGKRGGGGKFQGIKAHKKILRMYNCPKQNTPISLFFAGNLLDDEVALDWITTQATSESVEEVTPIVLSKLVGDARRLAVLFCE